MTIMAIITSILSFFKILIDCVYRKTLHQTSEFNSTNALIKYKFPYGGFRLGRRRADSKDIMTKSRDEKKEVRQIISQCSCAPICLGIDVSGSVVLSVPLSIEHSCLINTGDDINRIRSEMIAALSNPTEADVSYYLFLILASPNRDLDSLYLSLLEGNDSFREYYNCLDTIMNGDMVPTKCDFSQSITVDMMADRLRAGINHSSYSDVLEQGRSIIEYGINNIDSRPCCFNLCMEAIELMSDEKEPQHLLKELLSHREYQDERYVVRMIFDLIRHSPKEIETINKLEYLLKADPELITMIAGADLLNKNGLNELLKWLNLERKYIGTCLLDVYHRIMPELNGDSRRDYSLWIRKVLNHFDDTRDQLSISIY